MTTVSRRQYASLYGPTAGDRFRLADTDLVARVERSLILPGEEAIYGGGKSIRDGMAQVPGLRNADGALDLVITSVIVMDALIGIVKADIGVKDGRIVGVGQAGNPHLQDGVSADLLIGPGTEVISGEGLVATAGAIDSHVHFLTPAQSTACRFERGDDPARRRHRSRRWFQGHDVHTRPVEPGQNAGGDREPAGQRGLHGQGQQQPPGEPA